jgi:hypothetical protein
MTDSILRKGIWNSLQTSPELLTYLKSLMPPCLLLAFFLYCTYIPPNRDKAPAYFTARHPRPHISEYGETAEFIQGDADVGSTNRYKIVEKRGQGIRKVYVGNSSARVKCFFPLID